MGASPLYAGVCRCKRLRLSKTRSITDIACRHEPALHKRGVSPTCSAATARLFDDHRSPRGAHRGGARDRPIQGKACRRRTEGGVRRTCERGERS